MNIVMLVILVWLHFLADFVLQTDRMALNKSSSNLWLGLHAITYMLPFFMFGVLFALFNGAVHFAVDYITSRGTSRLWKKNERHWFFTLIGLDQAIHITTLILSYVWIVL